MDRRAVGSLLVALAVLLAGCGLPALSGAGTATSTGSPAGGSVAAWSKVDLRGGNFSFDAAVVYERVVRMYGLSLSDVPAVTVFVRNRTTVELTEIYDPSGFDRAMGVVPETDDTAIAGLAGDDRIWIYTEVVTTPRQREATLAHEFVHVVQSVLGVHGTIDDGVGGRSTQEQRVEDALTEGAATAAEHRYRVRYLGATHDTQNWRRIRAGRSTYGAFLLAPYVFGHRYVDARATAPEAYASIYRHPPQTTEQLLHNYSPGEEPPRPLSVLARPDGTDWVHNGTRTKGELFVRLVLGRELGRDAAAAADGWGNDRLVRFERGDDRGYAWVLRWDDAGEAAAFASAIERFLDAHADDRTGDAWVRGEDRFRVVRSSEETVAVLVGDGAFVADASVVGEDGDFEVILDGDEE